MTKRVIGTEIEVKKHQRKATIGSYESGTGEYSVWHSSAIKSEEKQQSRADAANESAGCQPE